MALFRLSGQFRRGFAHAISLDITSRVLAAVGMVILIQQLPTSDYAYVVLFIAVGQFAGSSATGGIRMLYLRNSAERVSRGSAATDDFLSCVLTQSAVLGALAVVCFAIAEAFHIGSWSDRLSLLTSATLFAFGMAASELAIAREQAHLRFVRAGLIAVVRNLLLLGVASLTFLGIQTGHEIAAYSAGVIAVLGLITVVFASRHESGPSRVRLKEWVLDREPGWLTIYYTGSAGFATVDVFIIAALLSSADVAAYGVAQRCQAVVLGALPALIAVFRVRALQLDVIDSLAAQRKLLTSWMRRLAVPLLISLCVIAVCAPFLIPLIDGGRYPLAIPIFELLMLSAISTYLVTPAPSLLMAQRRFRLLAGLVAATVVANVVGDILVAGVFGVVGVVTVAVAVDLSLSFALVKVALGSFVLKEPQEPVQPA